MMQGAWRISVLPPALVALVFVSLSRAVIVDFSPYPANSQDCLAKAVVSSNCGAGTENTVTATNSCLCSNGGNFVTSAAACLGSSDPNDLSSVYLTLKDVCSKSSTPLSVGEEQYLAAAGFKGTLTATQPTPTKTASSISSAAPTSTSPTTTTTAPETTATGADDPKPTKNANDSQGNKGLSTGVKAAVIAGSAVAGLVLLGSILYIFIRYRRRRDGEELHPMLPQENGHMSLVPTPAETIALAGAIDSAGDWPKDIKWRPASNPAEDRSSGFNWETPYDLAYPGEDPTPPPPPPSPPSSAPLLPTPRRTLSKPSLSRTSSRHHELEGSNRQPLELSVDGVSRVNTPDSSSQRYSGGEWVEVEVEVEAVSGAQAGSAPRPLIKK
ncbi:hypothetical protein B0T19DRAFT_212792 [Cercophora scortea]|uniref:Extracellular membrane protein CFEM domain-containing protein n=1 Tax=Cercophora scortea TaxID=314031 RepID=A0AAE0M9R4_9PEZI|nr:hypothetical protein B0T19DRAFT_212792 [Cercophora scortea]